MIITMNFDFFGEDKDLKEWDEDWKKACSKTEGIEYKGRYSSHQARYHWTYFHEADSYDRMMQAMQNMTLTRDRNVLSHAVLEIFQGPYHT
jgi:hypothetical protein